MIEHTKSRYDECHDNLERLAGYYSEAIGERNEATTRLQLIDRLLFECLGWERHDVLAEEHQREERDEYTDYTFYAPRRIMILEAKREGDTFDIPTSKVAVTYALKSIFKGNPGLKLACTQVARYCQSRGVPLAAVTNGSQLAAFVAARSDGSPPLAGRVLVFPSLPFMLEHFVQLWNALSKRGIENRHLQTLLLGPAMPELPPTLAARISDYPGTKGRNVFQAELKNVSELAIEDIPQSSSNEEEFLRLCYCQSGTLSQHSLASRAILKARYAAMFDTSSPGRPSVSPAHTKSGVSPEIYAEGITRRPVLLIGDVGVGKSMFIRHLVAIGARDVFADAIVVRIDLGVQATLTASLKHHVVREIAQQLADNYDIRIQENRFVRRVYRKELKELRNSIYGDLADRSPERYQDKEIELLDARVQDQAEHCRRSLQELSTTRAKQIVIFIDNADQRVDATQDEAFLIAQEMAHRWPVLVYIPLRPETFHRSVRAGALSGYHPKAFTISPPRIDRVLERRLKYALRIGDSLHAAAGQRPDAGRSVDNFQTVIRSFLASLDRNPELLECIDNIAGGNVRLALDLVKGFFGSGHVDTRNIVEKFKNGSYTVPLHEFIRATIYGDCVFYHPDRSPIANLFDVSSNDSREHFLLPMLLAILRQAGPDTKGFVETEQLYSALQGLGFTPEQIDFAIIRAHRQALVETPASQTPDTKTNYPRMFRATTIGLYHVDRLCSEFAYVDAMIVATPILDSGVRDQARNVHSVQDRLERAKLFQAYLDDKWSDATFGHASFEWPAVSRELTRDMEHVRRKAQKRGQ